MSVGPSRKQAKVDALEEALGDVRHAQERLRVASCGAMAFRVGLVAEELRQELHTVATLADGEAIEAFVDMTARDQGLEPMPRAAGPDVRGA